MPGPGEAGSSPFCASEESRLEREERLRQTPLLVEHFPLAVCSSQKASPHGTGDAGFQRS